MFVIVPLLVLLSTSFCSPSDTEMSMPTSYTYTSSDLLPPAKKPRIVLTEKPIVLSVIKDCLSREARITANTYRNRYMTHALQCAWAKLVGGDHLYKVIRLSSESYYPRISYTEAEKYHRNQEDYYGNLMRYAKTENQTTSASQEWIYHRDQADEIAHQETTAALSELNNALSLLVPPEFIEAIGDTIANLQLRWKPTHSKQLHNHHKYLLALYRDSSDESSPLRSTHDALGQLALITLLVYYTDLVL